MNFIKNLPLRAKLSLIAVVPFIALLYFLVLNSYEDFNKRGAAKEAVADVEHIEKISIVVHEIQKERALSLINYFQQSSKNRENLNYQTELTDKAIFNLDQYENSRANKNKHAPLFDSLALIRLKARTVADEEEVDEYYTELKATLLDEISLILRNSESTTLTEKFEEYLFLLYAKEYLAQLRTTVGKASARGAFEGNEFAVFAAAKGKYDNNLRRFKKIASPDFRNYFERKYSNPFISEASEIIETSFNDPSLINSFNFDDWWSASTANINVLKETEDYAIDKLINNAGFQLENATSSLIRNNSIGIAIILLMFLVISMTINMIIDSISKLKVAADSMAIGNGDIALDINSRDEIGELANSFKRMISVTNEFSDNAESIGNGDYTAEINVRSGSDTLGNALHRMKNNLQKLSRENQVRTWLLTGNAEMNNTMRGEKDVKDLAEGIINYMASYLKVQIGALYLFENNELKLTSSYAYHVRKQNKNSFKLGEGLVGQAAAERKSIIFTDTPDDYFKINSGLGQTSPKNIIVYPFLYEGKLKGVIELGSAHPFTDLDQEFMKIVSDNIAIAFHATQSRVQLKEFLEETQRQAEELETQQEELKQSNEELTEKTELLENSEAELKAQQEELQQANEELEEKANLLEEQMEKLENIKMDLENKARELEVTGKYKSEFLSNMSHELRTPLNSILILAQLLSENKNKSLTPKDVEFAKNICNSGNDLLNLINEILDLSKVEAGKMTLDLENVGLEQIKSSVRSMFSEVAKNKIIKFKIDIGKDLKGAAIVTDQLRLEQILRNLLSNAFKFTSKGGTVSLTMAKAKYSELAGTKFSNAEGIIKFSVTDTGIGIPKSKQSLIFEAFQQADGSTKRKYGGTGLGLSISRELANALGGEITIESTEGKGSTFTLFLPSHFDNYIPEEADSSLRIAEEKLEKIAIPNSVPDEQDDQQINDDRQGLNRQDKSVLIIEDDVEFAEILLNLIHEKGYKGIIATQGNTGLNFARHYKPNAILLDMKLPVVNGEEVLKQLKNDPELRHIPVQIISGFDRKKEGLELGAIDFVQKPVTKKEFFESFKKVETLLSKKIKKLLVVEDNVTQNDAIKELIGNGDVQSFSAFSGSEAYEMLLKNSFDCIIVDIGLPDMKDFELLEKIKRNKDKNNIPIIVYTGKDLTREESLRLNKLSNTVVLKTANSHERLFDETTLFLHRVESNLPKEKQNIIRKLHRTNEVLKSKNVLIVDDDIRNIYSLTNVLEEEEMNCLTAENGVEALKILEKNKDIDLILMDVMMPQMDGFEATTKIRRLNGFSKVPIIALTAKAMKGDREKCLEVGMSDYVSKPVNVEQLLSLMRVWLYK